MPQTKTTKKKPTAKVGGGGVGTRVSKFNLKIVIPIVLVVAALGGFYIFRKSGASSPLYRSASQLTGGSNVTKKGGLRTKLLNGNGASVSTWATGSELQQIKVLCFYFAAAEDATKAHIYISGRYFPTAVYGGNQICTQSVDYRYLPTGGTTIELRTFSNNANIFITEVHGYLGGGKG